MTQDLEMKLQEFEDWLIDEMRFSPSTVNSTIRKMKFVAEKCDLSREGIQEFIRRTWHSRGNKTANGYIQVLNRWLKFQRMKPMAYFKEYDSFTIKFCTPEQEDAIEEVRKVEFFLGSNSNQTGRYELEGNWASDPVEEQELILFFGEVVE
jgi:hypothetical protein